MLSTGLGPEHVLTGIEARGFIFGPPIALAIGAKFVLLRKPRKLPGEVISEEYVLEYGTDCLEMHVGAVKSGERALVVDDLIATGGTLCAAMNLLERAGAEVVECACVIELPDLKKAARRAFDRWSTLHVLVEVRLPDLPALQVAVSIPLLVWRLQQGLLKGERLTMLFQTWSGATEWQAFVCTCGIPLVMAEMILLLRFSLTKCLTECHASHAPSYWSNSSPSVPSSF
ncbi:adenine phosphoribosyltransferase 4 isoform X2 [Ricinus communis]|uniref:adenine phosphoribosyltransferase 4 isoform X2 n=1 Tax=Ricinus communis TaxID=3988 RepID=UPI00201B1510|nr:adenine phosphoribosyltransferase 4 isoform X2 [Ricinus communis]